MRAGFEALEDKSLPSLKSQTPEGVVAAAFKGIFKILTGNEQVKRKPGAFGITKVPVETGVRRWFGKTKADLRLRVEPCRI